jgi:CRP-like cAMP-binding protein
MSTRDKPASASLDIILFLKDVALFESLTNSQLAEVARLAERSDVPEGKALFNQGEPADCLYLIRKGKVRVITNGPEMARLGAGECTGEMAVLAGTERSATIETLEACQLLRFDADDFLALLDTYPEIQRALLKSMVVRLAQTGRSKEKQRASTIIGMVWGKDGPAEKAPVE